MASKNNAASLTLLAMGPAIPCNPNSSNLFPFAFLSVGVRPGDTLKPTAPQKAAGIRKEPPKSVPDASQHWKELSAAAAPPLEPPAVQRRSQGDTVVGKMELKLWEPFFGNLCTKAGKKHLHIVTIYDIECYKKETSMVRNHIWFKQHICSNRFQPSIISILLVPFFFVKKTLPAQNSGTLVFPTTMAPFFSKCSTSGALASAMRSTWISEPSVKRTPSTAWVSWKPQKAGHQIFGGDFGQI